MHCIKKITADLCWVGANDRRLSMFEGVYSVPYGVAYNSYLLNDEKTVLFDTVDKAVQHRFFENLTEALGGRPLDYLIVQHMEPDHSAAIKELVMRYPQMRIVCNAATLTLLYQFFDFDTGDSDRGDAAMKERIQIVRENDTLNTGKHTLHFVFAPMVHWPEVMVTYDATDKILFSADAFGCFGALNGALFADEVDFEKDYMDEARRYYANIVGKYGTQVQALLNKASALTIDMICPLHGFVWRQKLDTFIEKYKSWSNYEPEEQGVMIAYASVYGNTENAAEILSSQLRDRGIKTAMFDVSVTPASEIVSAAFRWSHLVFASTTYNAHIFVSMEALIDDLVAHNIQNRTVALIENGSWAPTSGGLMREKLENCKNINILDTTLRIKSSLKAAQLSDITAIADTLATTLPLPANKTNVSPANGVAESHPAIDHNTMFKLSYGLFVLTARDGEKDNGCIVNTALQITVTPLRISLTVHKANYIHDMIITTGEFNISILTESAPFHIFEQFGFHSGRDTDKFSGCGYEDRTANGIRYVPTHTNGIISAKVIESHDYKTHTLFIADVVEAFTVSGEPSVTYQYYFDHIKPKPALPKEKKPGFICKICGYVLESDTLPNDYICPLCKHGAADFERC
jgi:flavorubredoxin/flavin reductase (DIM6/NTAB) family NADH-FMN oxidoreductase RutF/rubredoxin